MRVAFDSRPLANPHGVGRYARCLLAALHETAGPDAEVVETQRPSAFARSRGTDLFHSPWLAGAMLHSPCPMVVTIHGLAALKRPSEHLRTGLRQRMRVLAAQRAASVIVPTKAVAADAVSVLGIQPGRITVIAEAADAAMYPRGEAEVEATRNRFGLPDDYLVWVGGLEHPDPSRHVAELAAAPRELQLVLVGSTRPWAHELPNVTLTGRVSDEHLAAIYSGARALVMPSEGEGFGLPAIEALACGTPVVAFDAPALHEVLAGRATLVEPGDIDGLIAAAESVRRPAPAPSEWTWQDTARETWGVYERALSYSQPVHAAVPARRRRANGPRAAAAPRIDGLEPR
ncbi:MAG TPA: glycosyltransferase family 1 protein [Solirubrobacteraceae bacterium]|nr:glycosyltransferase family 1 protein [Solirubrobacteraceae bacterium]